MNNLFSYNIEEHILLSIIPFKRFDNTLELIIFINNINILNNLIIKFYQIEKMNYIISISNKIEGKDCIIKSFQYISLYFSSMLENNSEYKSKFYNSYCNIKLLFY